MGRCTCDDGGDGCCLEYRERWSESDHRNNIVAAVSGAMFFSGWWIILDIMSKNPPSCEFRGIYYICGFTGTLGFLMINMISNRMLRSGPFVDARIGPCGSLIFLFLGFCIAFASLIASGWILIAAYLVTDSKHKWFGIAVFLQNLLIFLSALLYRLGRSEELWD